MSKVYLTTAIPYVNGLPHIGHVEDYLLADIYTRYRQLHGDEVRLQSGTDEHGNKIYKKAQQEHLDPQTYVDQNSAKFQEFVKKLGAHPTDFIRTTDPRHQHRVQEIWKRLKDYIYKDTYEGWYCEGCERFVTDKEQAENHGICPDHQAPYQRLSEDNYYLRISDFKDEITQAISSGTMRVLPDFRAKEVLKLLEDTPDVSISRPREHLPWGVPVPDNDDQVMYVWLDALSNYITVLGYPDQDISDYWPATVQFVGKDILRFHAIIWPAILLGLGLPLPHTLLSHGFILADGQKMSKSIGNVIDPLEVLDRHGLDAFRYYFSRHIDTFADSDFTWEKFDQAYSGELANDLGNLVQRLATLCHKIKLPKIHFTPTPDTTYEKLMDNFEFTKAIDYTWTKLQTLNRRIDETKPWAVIKDDPDTAKELLISLVTDLLQANHLLKPYLPISATIEQIFSSAENSTTASSTEDDPDTDTPSDIITPPTTPLFPKA